MNTRRRFLSALAGAALTASAGSAFAAQPTVEIIAMPHPPVKMALAPLRDWLTAQGVKVKVVELDVESAGGEKRLATMGLKGHIPIVVLVDGQYRQKRKDGSMVEFINFPAINGAPPGVRGEWTTADVQAVVTERMK